MKHRKLVVLLGCMTLAPLVAVAGEGPDGQARGAHWAELDTDGNGTISLAEAQAGAPRLAERFDGLDADGDGQLTREEMQAGRGKFHQDRRARGEERFSSADANGDGSIDLAEARAGMPRAAEHFAEIDRDGNGLLTHDELRSAMQAQHAEHRGRNKSRPDQPPAD
jgi:hypothetical protein